MMVLIQSDVMKEFLPSNTSEPQLARIATPELDKQLTAVASSQPMLAEGASSGGNTNNFKHRTLKSENKRIKLS